MISPGTFHRLRAAQLRSAREQQLLSGREWILAAVVVQLLSALHPLFAWFNYVLFGAVRSSGPHPRVDAAVALGLALVFAVLGWWARYAPFRAAVIAVIVYVVVLGTIGLTDPDSLLSGAIVKSLVLVGLLQAAHTGYLRRRAL
jgi:hypothetical protein